VLVPTDDHAVALLSENHEILANEYRLTVPPWKELSWACDKREMFRLAQEFGICQPWTAWPSSREELAGLDYPFPVILKPATRLGPSNLQIPKAWQADDRASLLARYDEASALIRAENLMVQELVPGGGEAQFSFAALCKDGSPLASVVARRTRQFPRDFGQFSTYVETVDEPQVVAPAVLLLQAARFTGIVEVEFKKDLRDSRYKLIDVNPRVWGWHTLSRRAGVDFPYLLWLLAAGEPVPQARGHAGERWMRLSADFPAAVQEILDGRLGIRTYVRSLFEPVESAIFAWDDPLPGLLEVPLFAVTLARRFLRRNEN
jgi:predicted ATP-grasp superfamily ATP-dependent carboligase